jgi:hypothetical protein
VSIIRQFPFSFCLGLFALLLPLGGFAGYYFYNGRTGFSVALFGAGFLLIALYGWAIAPPWWGVP